MHYSPVRLERATLRLACALAHSVPGVGLELTGPGGAAAVVAHRRVDAVLDPCGLRALFTPHGGHLLRMFDEFTDVRVAGGLEDLGIGLYRRRDGDLEERWLATLLDASTVTPIVEGSGGEPAPLDATATLLPDPVLDVTVVRLAATGPAAARYLDEFGFAVVSTCLVEELLAGARQKDTRA